MSPFGPGRPPGRPTLVPAVWHGLRLGWLPVTNATERLDPAVASERKARTHRRRVLELLWVLGSVGYGALRVLVADHTVKKYGVNIWGFAAVELVTSFGYGLGSARLAGNLIDRDHTGSVRWGILTVLTFIAPEAYIAITGRGMPTIVYVILGILLVVLGTIGVFSVRRRVRTKHPSAAIVH